MDRNREQYFYGDAGFSRFFRRSIDNPRQQVNNLADFARLATGNTREINFDQQQVSGNMSGTMTLDKIELNGQVGYMAISDDRGEVRAYMGVPSE